MPELLEGAASESAMDTSPESESQAGQLLHTYVVVLKGTFRVRFDDFGIEEDLATYQARCLPEKAKDGKSFEMFCTDPGSVLFFFVLA